MRMAAGAGAAFAALAGLNALALPSLLSMSVALAAMIVVTLLFFIRYVRTQRDFILMRHPHSEFGAISLAEFVAGLVFAISTKAASVYVQLAIGLVVLLLVRYSLRKVFMHDLRGIRGTPNPVTNRKLKLAPKHAASSAATA